MGIFGSPFSSFGNWYIIQENKGNLVGIIHIFPAGIISSGEGELFLAGYPLLSETFSKNSRPIFDYTVVSIKTSIRVAELWNILGTVLVLCYFDLHTHGINLFFFFSEDSQSVYFTPSGTPLRESNKVYIRSKLKLPHASAKNSKSVLLKGELSLSAMWQVSR